MDLPGDLLERSAKESARLLALCFLEDATDARLSPRSHQWRSLEFPVCCELLLLSGNRQMKHTVAMAEPPDAAFSVP